MAQLHVPRETEKDPGTDQFNLTEWVETAPFEDLLDMKIEHAQDGKAVLSLPFKVMHSNGGGVMHGGVMVSLADTAVAMAIKSLLPAGTHFATTELQMVFHAPSHAGEVVARANVSGPEGRTFSGHAGLYDDDDRLLAEFQCVFRVARGQGFDDLGEEKANTDDGAAS